MNKIVSPLKLRMTGVGVADLQAALRLILEKNLFRFSEEERRALEARLSAEQERAIFDKMTLKLVSMFQEQQGIEPTGEVDEKTAEVLNALLKKWNALDGGAVETPCQPVMRLAAGQVWREDGRPYAGGKVCAFHVGEGAMLRLGEDLTDVEGFYTIRYDSLPGVAGINLRIVVYNTDGAMLSEAKVIREAAPLEVVDLKVPISVSAAASYTVEGKVLIRISASLGGLQVRIMDKSVGGDTLLAETLTDDSGSYLASFSEKGLRERGKTTPDLQALVYSGDRFLAASDVRYNASNHETLHIRLPDDLKIAATLRSEHEMLTGALSEHFGGSLGDLKETDEQQDITYLANKTGWDARAVALASLADQFSARTADEDGQLEPAFFYALFRAGLPANDDALYQTDASIAESIWKDATRSGGIPASMARGVAGAVEKFRRTAARRALDGPALIGISPLKDLIAVTIGDDTQQQVKLADLYMRNRHNTTEFWNSVRSTFGEKLETRLKLDGQLAYMTLNNAPLIHKLHRAGGPNGLSGAHDLVDSGFYRARNWQSIMGNDPVPQEIPGENESEKRERYAELMAAQIRLSYPTAVVARMVKDKDTPLKTAGLAEPVYAFLSGQQGDFEIGVHPIQQYINHRSLQIKPEVAEEIERIQRVYQISPSDDAMNVLLAKGLDSAYAVVRHDRDEFIRTIGHEVGGEANARLIYTKSQQVHNTVLNLALSYRTSALVPDMYAFAQTQSAVSATSESFSNASDIIAYPALEKLFGEADYCSCEHCRSILSPAAYLVDLLLFLDRPSVPAGAFNPQTVLLDRRPDLQHLPLTCENTNLPVPYIDLVNETLEHYITHDFTLSGYTGHNTDGLAQPEELLANPQFVSETAYELLAGKPAQPGSLPPILPPVLPLPFHQPLENLRRYFTKFEAPLSSVMEDLRKSDTLERASEDEYGWRDILMEELRLSRAEYTLLTDSSLSLQHLYGFPSGTPEADAADSLSNAKALTRRLGISYEDLIQILKTRFMNPNAALIPKLERLGVPFAVLKAYKDGSMTGAELDEALAPHLDPAAYSGDIKAWIVNADNYANMMGLITLQDPDGSDKGCSFEKLELRYANPDPTSNTIRAFEFVRLSRFIRLWKKSGWSIDQLDKAITALYPADQTPNDPDDQINKQRLDAGFHIMLPRLGAVIRTIALLKLRTDKDLLPLLACLAPIDTHGENSLYRQMFLSPSLLDRDAAFADDGYGQYLDGSKKLIDHAHSLRAAFQLTGEELQTIIKELDIDATTPLLMDQISAVFRRGWLARKLKLSVQELVLLSRYTTIDPFAAPNPPELPLLRFIKLVNRLKATSVKPAQLLYLVWNQDISGRSAPDDKMLLDLALALRSGLATIEGEFSLTDDPDGQAARAKMAMFYGSEAADRFFGILSGSVVTDIPYAHDQPALKQEIVAAAQGGISYDNLRKRLIYSSGIMSDAIRDALKAVPGGASTGFINAVDELYRATRSLFAQYPELLPYYSSFEASSAPVTKKREQLISSLLAELKNRRKRQFALQTAAAAAKADSALASTALNNASILHASNDQNRPALDDLTALSSSGLSVKFFYQDSASGEADITYDTVDNLTYTAESQHKLPANPSPGSAVSGIWSGYVEAPENGFYNLYIEADPGASVTLSLAGATVPLSLDGTVYSNNTPIELRGGTLYPVSIQAEKVKDTFKLRWETSGLGVGIIPPKLLYPTFGIDRLRSIYIRFSKTAALASALHLTASEISFFASQSDYRIHGQGWLNQLPAAGNPKPEIWEALLKAFDALLTFASMKAALSPDDERLLSILQNPSAAAQNPDGLLYTLPRWEPSSVETLLQHFGITAVDLANIETLGRVYSAYAWVKKLGVSASALIQAAHNEPQAPTVRSLQSALRARYDESGWLEVLKGINDEMRRLQRDALVAYLLHRMRESAVTGHIDTPDKLFEYFLMDVQMEPCMQTSRVRHALSSVQLFIERSLMNLERRVSPSSINAKQWEWMSRYRVWEANRKIFLYPENWLEPELRDDQSPFFKEAMSELLQSDITEDSAAAALQNYLTKLEEVAKLEPCGIHFEEFDPNQSQDDISHVVARTAGANRSYFYRRREYGYWTPWEPIRLDIEDNPVIPVVWKGRMFLFWLRVLQQAPLDPSKLNASPGPTEGSGGAEKSIANMKLSEVKKSTQADAKTNSQVTMQAILCWSEYYNGKWQPVKTSDIKKPTELGRFNPVGADAFDRSKLELSVYSEGKDALRIHISGQGSSSFTLYNTHSLPVRLEDIDAPYFLLIGPSRELDSSLKAFTINYYRGFMLMNPDGTFPSAMLPRPVLNNPLRDSTVSPSHSLADPWDAPFFYEDSRHVFYVTTEERTVLIPKWEGYIPLPSPQKPGVSIPPLVVPNVPIKPRPTPEWLNPYRTGPDFGIVDPQPIERFISEDAYINKGIGTQGTIRFGNIDIGPAGRIQINKSNR
ncbi:neuraminidase-like domain-containing protein [Paenibacillus eucommiae]|uniref:PA14 domain-containing protein n=1 Tax=Paenibacillus eucommiae TaxID=1355755 RepID=A0ABS4ISG0_9BACL|nr:neuraminidase-like domain-containing protein [Paenibacillus eucommiae]MBP1990485.1 hypothetical protein [Paenibacillus eucommiae]